MGITRAFYGWYFPNESWLDPYFCDFVIPYVNECAQVAKSLNANCVNIIAPYNIKKENVMIILLRQLEQTQCGNRGLSGWSGSRCNQIGRFCPLL